jgi:hypothetical protein
VSVPSASLSSVFFPDCFLKVDSIQRLVARALNCPAAKNVRISRSFVLGQSIVRCRLTRVSVPGRTHRDRAGVASRAKSAASGRSHLRIGLQLGESRTGRSRPGGQGKDDHCHRTSSLDNPERALHVSFHCSAFALRGSGLISNGRRYFIKEGRVTESGTHDELRARKGDYHEYCLLQALSGS